MATVSAVGDGPIDFVGSDGRQLTIPLEAITFVDDVPTSSISADGLGAWLVYLVDQGDLVPGPSPAAPVALRLVAAKEGATGNDITIEVSAAGGTAVLIVTESHVYEKVSCNPAAATRRLADVLSDSSLVHLTNPTAGGTTKPKKNAAIAAKGTTPETWVILDEHDNMLVTLEARDTDFDSTKGTMTVGVDSVADDNTFTLTLEWVGNSVEVKKAKPGASQAAFDDLGFSVKLKSPPPAGMPAPGTYRLTGGADEADAQVASATLLQKP